ncbi:ankyrin repeat domain-containing protein [Sorangium sp. So ce1078]|uniref:ankyrin repeat domain-containing protein n=1 Tax=Sorangium sp. So ce1078 TaxID=3133329 RepID=UPI003F5DAEBA
MNCDFYGDCCADVESACAGARQDEAALLEALEGLDGDTVREIVQRGMYDPARIYEALFLHYNWSDLTKLELLVNAGAPVNALTRVGYSPLMYTTSDLPSAEFLLDAGADVEQRSDDCLTPLMVHLKAAAPNVWQFVQLFLARGADINAVTPRGNTSLMFALSAFRTGPIGMLLAAGADPSARNADGMIPLTIAVRHSLPNAVRELVAAGADINDVGPEGEPFWVYALVDNTGIFPRLTALDDELLEWVFTHPELDVDLSALGAADALAAALARPPVAHYAAYLNARGTNDSSLSAGELMGTHAGSELRVLDGHLRRAGLDITPLPINVTGRHLVQLEDRYYFLIDSAALPPGPGSVSTHPPDYSTRLFAYDAAASAWCVTTDYVNLHGMEDWSLRRSYGDNFIVSGSVSGQSSFSREFVCGRFTRPYRP